MAANAGEIRARLLLSNEDFKKKSQEAREDMKRMSTSADQLRRDFGFVQKASLAVGGAVVAAIGSSVKVAGQFEQSMAKVKGISGATEEEFVRLEKAAREAGASTVFSASEAAEGLSYLAMAGFDVNEQIKALPVVLNAAIAGQIDLGRSADIVSNIMTGFGLSADKAGQAVDVLVKASNTANTDIPQMGEAMKYVAPVAQGLGWSIEETAAAIGKLSDAGIQGGQAGTTLRAALLSLANPTGQTEKAMKRLKIEVLDTEGEMKSLPDLIGHINERMKGMTDAQKTAAAAQLVGREAAAGFVSLLKVGEDGLKDYTKELENSAGAAQEMADIQRDTLIGSFKEFQSALEEAGIKLGKQFLPYFREVVNKGTDVVRVISELDSTTVRSGVAFAGTAAAIALTLSTIGKLVLAIKGLMVSMGPAGWLITGISILGGILVGASAGTESLSESIERLSQEVDNLKSLDSKIEEFDRLKLNSRLTSDEFARFVDLTDQINRTTDPEKLAALTEEQGKLYEKSGLSNEELDKMVTLNGDLVEVMPSATEAVTDQGNAIIGTTEALKEYSKEKLESLYAELDLKRLETEVAYKDALKEEERIIRRKKDLHKELNGLQDVRNEKQDYLNEQAEKLNDMKENSKLYSELEIQNQQNIVNLAEKRVRKAEEDVAEHAKKVMKQDESLEKVREEIREYEEVSEQLIQVMLKQEGLTAEKGKGLEVVKTELDRLKDKKRQLEKNTDEAHKETDEYRNAKREIDKKIKGLETVYEKIDDITRNANDMNYSLKTAIRKPVTIDYNYTGSTGPMAPHRMGHRAISYHTGGIAGKPAINQLPKMHTGGLAADLFSQLRDRPMHNEIDARLLRREMILTEAQQANLMRMIDAGNNNNTDSSSIYISQVIGLLSQLLQATEEGKNYSLVMNDRLIGEMVSPHVTNKQNRNRSRQRKVGK